MKEADLVEYWQNIMLDSALQEQKNISILP
jgi:hypothetical protein